MTTQQQKDPNQSEAQAQAPDGARDSASQIWLAGLGAFAKAQQEGSKVFEALVREGQAIQRKTQAAAEEKLSEASSRMADLASGMSAKASGQWDRLETIFEERVSKALRRLGVPSARELADLVARIDELERQLNARPAKPGVRARTAKTATASAARTAKPRRPASGA